MMLRIALCKGPPDRLLSWSEGGSRAGFRNVVLDQKLDDGQSPKKNYVSESVNLGMTIFLSGVPLFMCNHL